MVKTIDNASRKTVLKNRKRIKFDKIREGDIIEVNNIKWKAVNNPYLSLDLPEGTLEVDLIKMEVT